MHQSINKKKIYFYLLILIFLSTIFNFNAINLIKKNNLITSIEIEGISKKEQNLLRNELQIFFNKNIFFIEKNKIITVLNKFNFLKDFNIQKVFPSKLVITAKKTKFLGSTFINGKKFYIGDNEKFTLANEIEKEKNLPIAFGKFSIKEFLELQNVLLEEKIDLNKVEKYFYHMSRRWDLQKNNGLIIMLPSKNISYSLELYNKLKNNNKINSAKIVDLRIPERVVINYE
tara:strand:+ start:929 stop:1618 length:690 start_codon:yes stop_codon:yes gene_type:complete